MATSARARRMMRYEGVLATPLRRPTPLQGGGFGKYLINPDDLPGGLVCEYPIPVALHSTGLESMSVDFGPVPFPASPIQEYFERRLKAEDASAASTNSGTTTVSLAHGDEYMRQQMAEALAELAENLRRHNDAANNLNHPSRPSLAAVTTGYAAFPGNWQLNRRNSGGT